MKQIFSFFFLIIFLLVPSLSFAQTKITVFGDSLVSGYRMDAAHAFPAQLELALRQNDYDVRITNAGRNGQTSAGGLRSLPRIIAQEPDLVILVLGANDMLKRRSPEKTYANLSAILERLNEEGIRVILGGMKALPHFRWDQAPAFNAIYPRLAEEYQAYLYPFFLEGVAGKPHFNFPDGVHPNLQGTRAIVSNIYPYVTSMLEQMHE